MSRLIVNTLYFAKTRGDLRSTKDCTNNSKQLCYLFKTVIETGLSIMLSPNMAYEFGNIAQISTLLVSFALKVIAFKAPVQKWQQRQFFLNHNAFEILKVHQKIMKDPPFPPTFLLFICLSVCLSLSLCLCLSVSLFLSLSVSLCPSPSFLLHFQRGSTGQTFYLN